VNWWIECDCHFDKRFALYTPTPGLKLEKLNILLLLLRFGTFSHPTIAHRKPERGEKGVLLWLTFAESFFVLLHFFLLFSSHEKKLNESKNWLIVHLVLLTHCCRLKFLKMFIIKNIILISFKNHTNDIEKWFERLLQVDEFFRISCCLHSLRSKMLTFSWIFMRFTDILLSMS
jgi:hypothetical protein